MKEFIKVVFAKIACLHDWDIVVSYPIQPVYPEKPFIVNEAGWGTYGATININIPAGHVIGLACNKCGKIVWN